jgi:hypothetical protein
MMRGVTLSHSAERTEMVLQTLLAIEKQYCLNSGKLVIVLAFAKLPNKSGVVACHVAFLEDSSGILAVPVSSLVEEMCVLSRSSDEFKNGIKAILKNRLYEEADDVEFWNIRYWVPQIAPKSLKRISEAPSDPYAASVASAAQLAAEKAADKKAKKLQ